MIKIYKMITDLKDWQDKNMKFKLITMKTEELIKVTALKK